MEAPSPAIVVMIGTVVIGWGGFVTWGGIRSLLNSAGMVRVEKALTRIEHKLDTHVENSTKNTH